LSLFLNLLLFLRLNLVTATPRAVERSAAALANAIERCHLISNIWFCCRSSRPGCPHHATRTSPSLL